MLWWTIFNRILWKDYLLCVMLLMWIRIFFRSLKCLKRLRFGESTPEALREARTEPGLPLVGLHLAIDPGHIGGAWAKWENRNFRINEEDYWVCEGELMLEVAQRWHS